MNQESIVKAIIPNSETPDSYIVHAETGELPTMRHDGERRTFEDTLHELAKRACGRAVGVDHRHITEPGVMCYQTKPVTPDSINPPYRWS